MEEKVGEDIYDMGSTEGDVCGGSNGSDNNHEGERSSFQHQDKGLEGQGLDKNKDKDVSEEDAMTLMSLATAAREKCPSCGGRRQGA